MDELTIERRGGLAGLPAKAKVDIGALKTNDRAALEALFSAKSPGPPAPGADRFTYAVTRTTAQGSRTIQVPETAMPPGLAALVKDSLP